MGIGFSIPTENTRQVTVMNYSHQGEFSYKGYSVFKFAQPNPVLFPRIIEEMEILFSHSGIGEVVEMRVVLEERGGNWQREIPVEVSGSSPISFPLDLEGILELGGTINEELGIRGVGYLLKIIAAAGTGTDPFIAILEGELSPSALEWNEQGFNKAERGFPGGDNWRQASFGYRVKLRENQLFGPITLERKPALAEISAVESDFPLRAELIESLDIGFDYRFEADVRINSLEKEAEVWMVIAEPGRWERSFTLLPPTGKQDEVTLNFPLDIGKLREMADDINREIGGRRAEAQTITIFARVHTIAETDYGTINEVFEHQLRGRMGEKIEWGLAGTRLALARKGAITQQIIEANPLSQPLRKFSLIGSGASFAIFSALAFLYLRIKPKPSFLKQDLQRNRKKYGELISEVSNLPIREGEVVIRASSLEALANISNNSLKPILLKLEPDKHSYSVIDGLIRYEYVRSDPGAGKASNHTGSHSKEKAGSQ